MDTVTDMETMVTGSMKRRNDINPQINVGVPFPNSGFYLGEEKNSVINKGFNSKKTVCENRLFLMRTMFNSLNNIAMKEQKKKKYEAPETKKTQVELEDGICAASRTGEPVVDDKNDKVNISEQGHGGWNGIGDDISGEWQ